MDTVDKKIKEVILKLENSLKSDVLIYYGRTEPLPVSGIAEMNHTDRNFFEYLRTVHQPKNKKVAILLHTNGGTISTAIELTEFLRSTYGYNITTIVCESARSSGTFLSLSADHLYVEDEPSAGMSDFVPISGPKAISRHQAPLFVEQFSTTAQANIGDGLLKFRSADDVFSIVNQISPLYIMSAISHYDMNFNQLKHIIPDELKALKEHDDVDLIRASHATIKEVMNAKDNELQKLIVFGDHHNVC